VRRNFITAESGGARVARLLRSLPFIVVPGILTITITITLTIAAEEAVPAAPEVAVLAIHLVTAGSDAPLADTRIEFVIPKGRGGTEVVSTAVTDDEGWAELKGEIGLDGFLQIYSDGRKRPLQTGRYRFTRERIVVDPLEVPPSASALVRLDLSDSLRQATEEGVVTKLQVRIGPERGSPPPDDAEVRAAGTTVDIPLSGEVLVEDLAPGRWSAMVMATIGPKLYVLDPGNDHLFDLYPLDRQQITIPARVPLVTGRVTWKGEPFVAHLNMRPASGNESRTPTQAIVTDENGVFAFPFPDVGKFHFMIAPLGSRDREEMFFTHVYDVGVTHNRPVEIVVPAGLIEGRVVAEDGSGVKGIRVQAKDLGPRSRNPWDASDESWEDGRFALEGLEGGTWEIVASGPGKTSEPRRLVLEPKGEIEGLTLVLSLERLQGRIIGTDSPAGPIVMTADTGQILTATADPEGNFRYGDHHLEGRRLNVVMTWRDGIHAWPAHAADGLELQLPSEWGTAVFTGSFTRDDRISKGFHLVNDEGGFIRPSTYARTARENSIVLSAGRWTLARFDGPAVPGGRFMPVDSFIVPAGGVVVVPIPE
jgi:hypothetical protein